MTTQLCFDPKAIASFIAARRAEGIDAAGQARHPGRRGDPEAPLDQRPDRRQGREQVRAQELPLRRRSSFAPAASTARRSLVRQLAPLIADPAANVMGLHVYTFNNVAATEEWRAETFAARSLRRLAGAARHWPHRRPPSGLIDQGVPIGPGGYWTRSVSSGPRT